MGSPHHPPPPPYTSRTAYFPSHFFPEKMYHYWQYYYPARILPPPHSRTPVGLAPVHGLVGPGLSSGGPHHDRFFDSRFYERY